MVTGMTFFVCSNSICFKNSACLLSALLLIACQPPAPADEHHTTDNSETVNTPLIVSADSVTMTPEYILNIKSLRYQPSLGLQGNIEPVKQTKLIAARALSVEKVLVTKGQWVEKGTPLLIVRRQVNAAQQTNLSRETDTEKSGSTKLSPTDLSNAATTNNEAKNQNAISSAASKDASSSEPLPNTQQDNNNKSNSINKTATLTTDANRTSEPSNLNTSTSTSTITKSSVATTDDIGVDAPNRPSSNESDVSKSGVDTKQNSINSKEQSQMITVRASFSGRVDTLYVQAGQQIDAREPLLHLSDETDLRFIATLPIQAEPQLSVGQTVNFTTEGLSEKFTGQVSNLMASDQPDQLLVYVHVIKNDASRNTLKPDMFVTGRVNYGQIEVGTVVPKRALHDVDLTTLQMPPYQPLTPLAANVWIIKQDQRLTRQPVEVIKYDPSTGQYLIAGISNDSLISLADLPIESAGKKVIIS